MIDDINVGFVVNAGFDIKAVPFIEYFRNKLEWLIMIVRGVEVYGIDESIVGKFNCGK